MRCVKGEGIYLSSSLILWIFLWNFDNRDVMLPEKNSMFWVLQWKYPILHFNKIFTVVCAMIYFFYLVCEAIGTAATPGLLCQPRVIVKMIVEKQMECRCSRGNRSSRRKPATAPLLSITKSHMTRSRFIWTRAAAVGSRRLTAWAMARPKLY
jgi:hypothetical protein